MTFKFIKNLSKISGIRNNMSSDFENLILIESPQIVGSICGCLFISIKQIQFVFSYLCELVNPNQKRLMDSWFDSQFDLPGLGFVCMGS